MNYLKKNIDIYINIYIINNNKIVLIIIYLLIICVIYLYNDNIYTYNNLINYKNILIINK